MIVALRLSLGVLLLCLATAHAAMAGAVRIKDLVEFDGVRGNDLLGYGLVVGLSGSGDGLRNSPFTEELMSNILERLGVNVTGEQFRPRNCRPSPARAARSTSPFPPSATPRACWAARW
jgi:flagellar P-ring protein precursor FlgI